MPRVRCATTPKVQQAHGFHQHPVALVHITPLSVQLLKSSSDVSTAATQRATSTTQIATSLLEADDRQAFLALAPKALLRRLSLLPEALQPHAIAARLSEDGALDLSAPPAAPADARCAAALPATGRQKSGLLQRLSSAGKAFAEAATSGPAPVMKEHSVSAASSLPPQPENGVATEAAEPGSPEGAPAVVAPQDADSGTSPELMVRPRTSCCGIIRTICSCCCLMCYQSKHRMWTLAHVSS